MGRQHRLLCMKCSWAHVCCLYLPRDRTSQLAWQAGSQRSLQAVHPLSSVPGPPVNASANREPGPPDPSLLLALLLPSRAPAAPLSPELSPACQLSHSQRLLVPEGPSLSALNGHLSQPRKEKGTEDTGSFHHIYWGQACTRCWGLPGGQDRDLP